jgi:transcription initiation factor IIE alpha subunit
MRVIKNIKKTIGKRKLNDFYIKYNMIKAGNNSTQLKKEKNKIVEDLTKKIKDKMVNVIYL